MRILLQWNRRADWRKRNPPTVRTKGGFRQTRLAGSLYSTPRLNLFDFGKPCARRPASARLPRQSDRSLKLMLWSRPAESFQDRPTLESKTAISDSEPPVYFCNR